MIKGIETILMMIPKGGKYAKSVVNFVHKAPKSWSQLKQGIKQIEDWLKQGSLRLDGKQKTIFETNKNILKNHEKVTKKVEIPPSVKKTFPPFNVSKEDFTKGWTPTLIERSRARNIYKELEPPKEKYTKEMEAIDEELDALAFGGDKYKHLSVAEKNKIMKTLQAEMKDLIKVAMKEDLTKLSLSQINKRSQSLQKRIRGIADNPNIKGTVTEGPKSDMIDAIYKGENTALTNARKIITRNNSLKKYGDKFPRLDPDNSAFIITGLDSSGNPMKVGRFTGRFSALKDPKTGELTRKEGTSYYDKWNAEKNQIRKPNEEVFHETVDAEGKTIMSNPNYKVTTKNMEIWNELYSDMSTSDLAKKGFKLKDIDMLMKGREARKYLQTQEAAEKGLDTGIKMHERTNTNEISNILEDLYHRGDDVYKMSIEEWITKIPEHFAEGGRTGFRSPGLVTKGIEKGIQLKRLLAEGGIFAALAALTEAGITGVDKIAEMMGKEKPDFYKPSDFYKMFKKYMAQKELLKRYEVLKTRGGPEMQEDYSSGYYKEHMPKITYEEVGEKRNKHATGGVSNLFRERQGYRSGELITGGIKLVKGARWLIRMLKDMLDDMIYGGAKFAKMAEAEKIKYFKQTQAAIKSLESGGPIPDEILTSLRNDARFKDLTVTGKDKEFIEIQEVVLGKPTKGTGETILEGKVIKETVPKHRDITKMTKEEKAALLKKYQDENPNIRLSFIEKEKRLIPEGTTAESIDEAITIGNAEREKVELFAFMNELPKELQHKVALLPIEQQIPLLRKFKEAFEATKTRGVEGGVDVLQKQLLEDFPIPKGKPHATGGLIPGYATGGVSNLFRQRYRSGKAVELITKLPEFIKFVEGLLIKASNQIRRGQGKWKDLDIKQKTVQHDNLTKMVTEFQKTKKFDVKMNEYFGIDAEKAFIKAQAKVTPVKKVKVTPVKKERTMDDLVEDAYQEVFYQKPSSGDYKYDADVLATEIAYQGGKIYDDLAAVEKAGIYDLAYKRVIKDLKFNMDRNKILKDVEQKMQLSDFDPKGKPHAQGGLIPGYATGGVSNLFRSR
jgi:hypothetical protein